MRDLQGILHDYTSRVICIRGVISSEEIDSTIDFLFRLDSDSKNEITLYFLSPSGGSLADVIKMADVIRAVRSKIRGIGIGLLQGAGTPIFSMCAKRILSQGSLLCFEGLVLNTQSSRGNCGFSDRQTNSALIENALLKGLEESGDIGNRISRKLNESINAPVIMTPSQALEMGFADQVLKGRQHLTKRLISYGI